MDMDVTFLDRIVELGRSAEALVYVNGESYSTVDLHHVRPPKPELRQTLVVSTLAALVGYVVENRDGLALDQHMLVIDSPFKVQLVGPATGYYKLREVPARAVCSTTDFVFGKYMKVEDMLIELMTQFDSEQGDVRGVLRWLGNLTAEEVRTAKDDGVSQSIAVRAGAFSTDEVRITNPVQLAPWDTFREIQQVLRPLVLRVSTDGDKAALFEADGGSWWHEARLRIGVYLKAMLRESGVAHAATVPVWW
jgi:hypothetical protein